MARLGRYFLRDQPLHVIQRGNNREAVFFGEDDYARYRDWLAAAAVELNGVRVDLSGGCAQGVGRDLFRG